MKQYTIFASGAKQRVKKKTKKKNSLTLLHLSPSVLLGPGPAGVDVGCIEFGRPQEKQGLSALLQRLQHPDHHPLLLRGHHTHTQ